MVPCSTCSTYYSCYNNYLLVEYVCILCFAILSFCLQNELRKRGKILMVKVKCFLFIRT